MSETTMITVLASKGFNPKSRDGIITEQFKKIKEFCDRKPGNEEINKFAETFPNEIQEKLIKYITDTVGGVANFDCPVVQYDRYPLVEVKMPLNIGLMFNTIKDCRMDCNADSSDNSFIQPLRYADADILVELVEVLKKYTPKSVEEYNALPEFDAVEKEILGIKDNISNDERIQLLNRYEDILLSIYYLSNDGLTHFFAKAYAETIKDMPPDFVMEKLHITEEEIEKDDDDDDEKSESDDEDDEDDTADNKNAAPAAITAAPSNDDDDDDDDA